jgi:TPR repeat protein
MAEDERAADADRRSRFGGGWFGDDYDAQESSAADDALAVEVADWLQALHLSLQRKPKEDPELWKPHPPTEACPVCLVPLPLQRIEATNTNNYWVCCGQKLCLACEAETDRALLITNRKRKDKKLPPMELSCAFCREPVHEDDSDFIKRYEERINKGDVDAMTTLGERYRLGLSGLVRDEAKSLELYTRAADLGCPDGLARLGICFVNGGLGVTKDMEKAMVYFEDAAKKGHVVSRINLGILAQHRQKHDLALKHYRLAAAAGFEPAVKELWKYFSSDQLTKAELEETLRAHHAACNAMKSEERERFDAWKEAEEGNDVTLKQIYRFYYEGLMAAKELKVALKVHGSGDVDQVNAILSKCWKLVPAQPIPYRNFSRKSA